jgi:hypothetical protein
MLTAHSRCIISAVTECQRAVPPCDAGIVDQHIEPAEAVVDALEHLDDGGLVGDVGLDGEHAAAERAQLVGHSLRAGRLRERS